MLLDILSSAGIGTLLGGVFGWLGKREERKNLQMKLDHEVAMIQARTAQATQVAKLAIDQAKVAGQLAVEQVEAQAFAVSQQTTGWFAEGAKAIVRPVILFILMWQTWRVNDALEELAGGITGLPAGDVIDLYRVVVLSIIGLTGTAVGWYFAQRTSKQFDRMLATVSAGPRWPVD